MSEFITNVFFKCVIEVEHKIKFCVTLQINSTKHITLHKFMEIKFYLKHKSVQIQHPSYSPDLQLLNQNTFVIIPDISIWFYLFNGISTFVCYLLPKPSFQKDSSGTI